MAQAEDDKVVQTPRRRREEPNLWGVVKKRFSEMFVTKNSKKVEKQDNADAREQSKALDEDPFARNYDQYNAIIPPFNMYELATMPEKCGEMTPSVDAMAINIEKLGHRIVPRPGVQSENEQTPLEIQKQISIIENFFSNSVIDQEQESFEELRARVRKDLETTGNAYIEVIPKVNQPSVPAGLKHLPSWTVRLCKLCDEYTPYEVPRAVKNPDGSWRMSIFPDSKQFRRFVQIRESGAKAVYFKEWNDPRDLNSETGEFKGVSQGKRAHEIIHLKLYSSRSPYGLPRWIGRVFAIYGSRAAEEINYTTFENNQMPGMALLATNVAVTDGSLDRMKEFVEERIQGNKNYATILLIEAEPVGDAMRDPSAMKMDLKPLTEFQHADAMFKDYITMNNEMIRRSFRLPPIFVGRCVPVETEFLTADGWKRFDDIRDGESIATVRPESGELEFQVPSGRYVYDYDGKLVRFSNGRAIDAVVTPNHRMLQRGSGEWDFVEAQDIKKWHREFMLSSLEWSGEEREEYSIPHVSRLNASSDSIKSKNVHRDFMRKLSADREHERVGTYSMDLFLEFLGYFVSEGSTTDIRGPIVLSQNVGRILERMDNVVQQMGFDPCSGEIENNQGAVKFSNVSLWTWLRENCGIGSKNKRFPRWILDLSRRQLGIFYRALMDGDGSWCHRGREGSGIYSTTSEFLADLFQELCFRLGYRTSSRYVIPEDEGWSPKWVITISANPINHSCDVHGMMTWISYKGQVCCFTTQNGTIVTRNNGKILISGNSEDYNRAVAEASRKLAEEQIFLPERKAIDRMWTNTIIMRLGVSSVIFKSNKPNVTDNYELTQVLATAERSGGLTPRTSSRIVEDVLGEPIPEPLPNIKPDQPFSMTMLEKNYELQLGQSSALSGPGIESTKSFIDFDSVIPFVKHILDRDSVEGFLDDVERNTFMRIVADD